jgi:alginate O-acetyltransferase complex protein AlgI
MLFCSQKFLVFFLVVFTVYWAIPRPRIRVWLLLGASFYFYASWNAWLALLIGVSTVMDYLIARGCDYFEAQWKRKLLLFTSLAANLGLLVYFKYSNFFIEQFYLGFNIPHTPMDLSKIFIPIGISFYTFEAINYTVDVYRRKVPAEKNIANFMLFITFFPHLVAGPIVRARDFLPQIHRVKHWDWARIQLGTQLFLMGLFKKLAIADRMALFADPVFDNPQNYNTTAAWLAVVAFAIQIYCDFSGYTDMALGIAHMFGYKLSKNFNMPYISKNVSEFWRRWHISLSTWLRDYLFIPLGGSRGTSFQTCRNLMITMTLGGLWHGANWTFVVWGVLHGLFLVVHRYWAAFSAARPKLDAVFRSIPGSAVRMLATFLCVALTWVFFRAKTFALAGQMFRHLFIPHAGLTSPLHNRSLWATVLLLVICHLLGQSGVWKRWSVRIPAPVLGFGYAMAMTVALVLAPDSGKAFIYFNF